MRYFLIKIEIYLNDLNDNERDEFEDLNFI